jgi:hypothetical protein
LIFPRSTLILMRVSAGFRVRLSAALLMLALSIGASARSAISVGPGGDLQAAINAASSGDVITLTGGATYTGNFVLPVHGGSGVVTIRTRPDAQLPAPGQRVSPEDAPALAKLQSGNSGPTLRTAAGAHGWRLELLEFGPSTNGAGDIIQLGDGSLAQSTLAQVPRDLVIDRCYIHGDPSRGQKRGIALNSAATEIIGSHIDEIKAIGMDTQAIGGWNGPGPFRIENNHLEAAGEVFMLGGGTPGIRDLIPSDVIFTRNYVGRPPAWTTENWAVKNLLELKNARRVVISMNVFEHHWVMAQPGYAIVFTPRGEHGAAPWATVEDVTFRLNVVREVAAGINILGHDDAGPSGLTRRIQISENLFYGFDRDKWKGNGFFLLISQGPTDITVQNNTVLQRGNIIEADGRRAGAPISIERFIFRDNITLHNGSGVHGGGRGVGKDSLNAFFPDAEFDHNVLAGGRASLYPPENFFPSPSDLMGEFVAPDAGDFQLKAGSKYLTAGADGGALGAPMRELRLVLEGLRSDRERTRPTPPRGRGSGG